MLAGVDGRVVDDDVAAAGALLEFLGLGADLLVAREEVVAGAPLALDERRLDEDLPGDDRAWMEFIGNHEGGHIDGRDENDKEPYAKLSEETKADRAAVNQALLEKTPELGRAFLMFRALCPWNDEYATYLPIMTGEPRNSGSSLKLAGKS